MVGVVLAETGNLVGVFGEAAFADALVTGLHQEQMRVVGHVQMEYTTVYLDPDGSWQRWTERVDRQRRVDSRLQMR